MSMTIVVYFVRAPPLEFLIGNHVTVNPEGPRDRLKRIVITPDYAKSYARRHFCINDPDCNRFRGELRPNVQLVFPRCNVTSRKHPRSLRQQCCLHAR